MEIPLEDRIQNAIEVWRAGNGLVSQRKIAKNHGISRITLTNRIAGKPSKNKRSENLQRLTPEKENLLKEWIKRL